MTLLRRSEFALTLQPDRDRCVGDRFGRIKTFNAGRESVAPKYTLRGFLKDGSSRAQNALEQYLIPQPTKTCPSGTAGTTLPSFEDLNVM